MTEQLTSKIESPEKSLLPKELFVLQVEFAYEVARQRGLPLHDALLRYTSAHARMFHHPAQGVADGWAVFVAELSEMPENIVDSIYDAYVAKEETSGVPADRETFGCFSHQYKEARNTFVLHFGNHDPAGNLGKDRREARLEDLRRLTESIAAQGRLDARVQMTSWLLSIDAFKRLLPEDFVSTIDSVEQDVAQDNGLWGQFLDKEGKVKKELAEQLLTNLRSGRLPVTDCFPCKLKTAKVPQEVFFEKYL